MKGLITAGGRGTRLRPITHTKNKHLIPVAGKPIIVYAIETLKEAGITDIGITYNADLDTLQSFLKNGEDFGVNLVYIHQKEPIGLADCIRVSKDFLKDDSFVFFLGDNLLAGGILKYKKIFEEKKPQSLLLLSKVQDPQRFGVPEFDKAGKIVKIEEKPESPKSDFAITGIYFYDSTIFKAFEGKNHIVPSERGELEISDVHQYLIDHGYTVLGENITGWWKDTGKPNDLLFANRLILEKHTEYSISESAFIDDLSSISGNISVGDNSKIINSVIRGPVYIGNNTIIENSYIGPFTSIGNNNSIVLSEIEHSLLLDNISTFNIQQRIDESIIGDNVIISKKESKPAVYNLYLGDHSIIKI
jgi:glucose-1-phosphate thymidylyltransferase